MKRVIPFKTSLRHSTPWLLVLVLTAVLTTLTTSRALTRYREFRTGWSWDLAYYNQWFWSITRGDGVLSVRPIAAYADEGPSAWKTNYLSPARYLLIPIYFLWSDPEVLLVVQNVVFWWGLPAAFGLLRSEGSSNPWALAGLALVPATPLLWPLVWNDFRELQLALPFVLWAIQGVRSRRCWLSALGIGGMLACRQEFALVVASMAILPPRNPEDVGKSYRWARTLLIVGLAWFLFGFFGYLRWMIGPSTPEAYLSQFTGPKAGLDETLATSLDFLAVGLGAWAILACLAPRVGLLAVPWVLTLARGRWALPLIATEQWHHVRYTALFVFLALAAGLIGFAKVGRWLDRWPGDRWRRIGVWTLAAVSLLLADRTMASRLAQIPQPISTREAAEVWQWIDRVGPDDGVLAAYEVTAPLSSRRLLYSNVMDKNKPPGYPRLESVIRWVFILRDDPLAQSLSKQGFELVHTGSALRVYRRRLN
ncbi:MAG: DUF2079 domain-containing protein [Isosphaeraceae bacterium]